MSQNSVTSIKCRFSNAAHKLIDQKYGIKNSKKWSVKVNPLTDAEKVKLFDELVKLDQEISSEIGSALYKRREKKRVNKARAERGYVAKKKTPKVVQ